MILLLPLLAWAGSPVLTLDGACPGPVTVSVADLAPGAQVGFLSGARGGADRIPAGGCAGVFTELAGLSLVAALRDGDGDGVVSVTPELGAELCGVSLQAVDLSTCATTRPATLLGGDGCRPSGARANFDTLESSTVTGCYTGDPCDHDDLLLWPADSAVFAEWGEALTCAAPAPTCVSHVGITTWSGADACQGAWDVYCDEVWVGHVDSTGRSCTGGAMVSGCQADFPARWCSAVRLEAVPSLFPEPAGCCESERLPDSFVTGFSAW
jgi:hypothetical protein